MMTAANDWVWRERRARSNASKSEGEAWGVLCMARCDVRLQQCVGRDSLPCCLSRCQRAGDVTSSSALAISIILSIGAPLVPADPALWARTKKAPPEKSGALIYFWLRIITHRGLVITSLRTFTLC